MRTGALRTEYLISLREEVGSNLNHLQHAGQTISTVPLGMCSRELELVIDGMIWYGIDIWRSYFGSLGANLGN